MTHSNVRQPLWNDPAMGRCCFGRSKTRQRFDNIVAPPSPSFAPSLIRPHPLTFDARAPFSIRPPPCNSKWCVSHSPCSTQYSHVPHTARIPYRELQMDKEPSCRPPRCQIERWHARHAILSSPPPPRTYLIVITVTLSDLYHCTSR